MAVVDEQSKKEIKDILINFDRTLLVADPRRREPKKCVSLYCVCSTKLRYEISLNMLCAVCMRVSFVCAKEGQAFPVVSCHFIRCIVCPYELECGMLLMVDMFH